MKAWLDLKFHRFSWYRKLLAYWSRKKTALKTSDKEVEVYTPKIPEKELKRAAIVAANRLRNERRLLIGAEIEHKHFFKGMTQEEYHKASAAYEAEIDAIYARDFGKE